jgi:hypothetical protein
MVVHGNVDAVRSRVTEHREAGANHVCLQVLGSELTDVPYDDWRQLGAALQD